MQNRRVYVMNIHTVCDWRKADLVCLADSLTGLNTAARKPHREGLDMMITPDAGFLEFTHWRAAELASPNDKSLIEEAPLL